ncbi:hypothetical protein BCR43DRAFT_446226 [Syncephalastrum racemosum]|uniref:RBR-type E3 ubiquitin transferase n=1 Tax=Syncephalastrum racemosum TaxID=13706 RepID=A0A1X2H353_SYNRA|nr:hypothetical protein BCR43DRAFT_446226 [Syncephalastrum racemosum]
MDYWLQRCSICFDAQLDLCLEYCRDQYCLDCFRRYVTEVVTSSWGLSVTKIRCPVCQDLIPQSEWSKFVPGHVVEQYNRFNQPYRSFSRCCPHCETEAFPCDYRERQQYSRYGNISSRSAPFLCVFIVFSTHIHTPSRSFNLVPPAYGSFTMLSRLSVMHVQTRRNIFHDACPFAFSTEDDTAYTISRYFLLQDMKPETWKKLQLAHISFFPSMQCPSCDFAFCLQCGHENHAGEPCEQYMQRLVANASQLPDEVVETVKWKLHHSCSIMINRDEGCNKVDCSYCGFTFCWACRSPWSETELGVPNISSIQARMLSGINI